MQQLIEQFPQQLHHALQIAQQSHLRFEPQSIHHIIVSGLGGSGIGGNILQSFAQEWLEQPVLVNKTYTLPHFVGKHSLVVASSFSGNTEETLFALQQAIDKQATIVCITAGGKLLELARQHNLDYIQIPQQAPCPRAFVGYSLVQMLHLLHHFNPEFDLVHEVQRACQQLETYQPEIQQEAKRIAKFFHTYLPIAYADERWQAALLRLQQQINENAKQLCHTHVLPEMNHNELVGWGLPTTAYQQMAVLLLRSSLDHPRIQARMNICKPILAQKAARLTEVSLHGTTFFEQMTYALHLFDWVSYYLAQYNQVDPFPVDIIQYLKDQLAQYENP